MYEMLDLNDNKRMLGVVSRHIVKCTEESLIYPIPCTIVCLQFSVDSGNSFCSTGIFIYIQLTKNEGNAFDFLILIFVS